MLWLDLETTGDQPGVDEIVEVAAIRTGRDLVEQDTFTGIVPPSPFGFGRIESNPIVRDMHITSGLLAELRAADAGGQGFVSGNVLAGVEQLLLSWFPDDVQITIAGSGVAAFDIPMIRVAMPALAARLTYFSLDVGPLRRFYHLANGRHLVEVNKQKTHRAMDDVLCHLEEGRAFRDLFRGAADCGLSDSVRSRCASEGAR